MPGTRYAAFPEHMGFSIVKRPPSKRKGGLLTILTLHPYAYLSHRSSSSCHAGSMSSVAK